MATELDTSCNCNSCSAWLSPLINRLSADASCGIISKVRQLRYKKGEVIFKEGETPRNLYCIHKGKVKITQTGIDGKVQVVHLAHEGDVLGYRAILGEDRYSCSGTTMEDSILCVIPRKEFSSLVEQNPQAAIEVIRLLTAVLKETEKKVTIHAQRPVKERLAQCLLMLKDNFGLEADGTTINVNITREEIASIAGTTRETVIRLLADLTDEHVVEVHNKRVKILNLQGLTDVARISA